MGTEIEGFVKIKKKNIFFFGGVSGRGGGREGLGGGGRRQVGGQGGCERRSKVFVKIQKKIFFEGGGLGRGWGGGRSDQELGWGRWG